MKLLELLKKYPIEDRIDFMNFVKSHNLPYKETLSAIVFPDDQVQSIVDAYLENGGPKTDKIREELSKRKNILTTSCSSLEGYTVKRQLGIVFGEIVVRCSLKESLSSFGKNVSSMLTLDSAELTGTTMLMNKARERALEKLYSEAINKGANAIIGVDCESSVGLEIMKITIYGTAVYVEKIDD